MRRLLVLFVALALATVGCGGDGLGADLSGTWVLTSGTGPDGPVEVPPDARIDLRYEDGTFSGTAACNSYFADVETNGDHITIGGIGATEMACDPPRMTAESTYLAALSEVDRLVREDDVLTLSGDGVELTYVLEPPTPDASLAGTTWELDTLLRGDAASTVLGDPAHLELDDDGTFRASTGRRDLGGSWARDGDAITTAQVAVDDVACPDELRSQDELVLDVLSSGFTVEIEGTRLTLRSGDAGLGYTTASP